MILTPLPILLLDDEPEILKALKRDLRKSALVDEFTDPAEALRAFGSREYAVVVSDLKMPNMNGLEFLFECSKIRPHAQRVLLTAHADLADIQDSINKAKINLLLTKPWEPEDLRAAIDSVQRQADLARENNELRRLALTDALTGISNHRYFWERLESEFSRAQRFGRPLSLIMADIDDFKKYNDQFGHPRGDAVLKDVATTMDRARRSMDTVARYGGEEFGVILPEASSQQALDIAKRTMEIVKTKTGLSLGVASFPDDASSTTQLVDLADKALLTAKKQGKAQVVSYTK